LVVPPGSSTLVLPLRRSSLVSFTDPPTTEIYPLSLHDALPILAEPLDATVADMRFVKPLDHELVAGLARSHDLLVTLEDNAIQRSEEHTSELQSRENLVCRLLLEKKKKKR